MTTSIYIYILSGILVLDLILLIRVELRFRKLLAGTKAKDLEEVMHIFGKHIKGLEDSQKKTDEHLKMVDERLNKSIRKVETLRFNPFADAGSNQSFAISLINDEGDGVILSSLYARDRMSIFAKPIQKGKSDFELSSEEEEVLKKSR